MSLPKLQPAAEGRIAVWLSALGLSIGLCLVLGLLALVLVKGLAAFWPGQVVALTLTENSPQRIQNASVLAGEIVRSQEKFNSVSGTDRKSGLEASNTELQLFVGNRDVYGFSFLYLDESEIVSRSHPLDLARIERLKEGPVLGYLEELRLRDGTLLHPDEAGFEAELHRLIREGRDLRKQIRQREKSTLAHLNRSLQQVEKQLRLLDERPRSDQDQSRRITLLRRQEALEANLTDEVTAISRLRANQDAGILEVRLPTGQSLDINVADLVSFHFPNALNPRERLGMFAGNAWRFISGEPRNANTEGGIFPAIYGTVIMTLLMCVAVMPLGVIAAIYLREYAVQGPMVQAVRIAINNLAGIPSIVFGVFGLGFFVYLTGGTIDSLFFQDSQPSPTFGTGGILWASLTLALMTVPVVIVSTEEAIAAIPRGAREGSLACGASQWQTIQRIIFPAAAPGMLTGLVLAMARGAGEVAPLMLVGVVKLAPSLPLDLNPPFLHLDQKFMHLGFHIYDLGFQSPDSEAVQPMVFATALFLIALVIALNLTAIIIRERLRRRNTAAVF